MPDWTYQPLRGIAGAVLGVRRSQRLALRVLAWTGSLPGGGTAVARLLGHRHPPSHLRGTVGGVAVPSRLGAVVPPEVAWAAIRALPPLGAGVILVEPVTLADVDLVRRAAAGRRILVLAGTTDPAVTTALAPHVDAILPPAVPQPAAGQHREAAPPAPPSPQHYEAAPPPPQRHDAAQLGAPSPQRRHATSLAAPSPRRSDAAALPPQCREAASLAAPAPQGREADLLTAPSPRRRAPLPASPQHPLGNEAGSDSSAVLTVEARAAEDDCAAKGQAVVRLRSPSVGDAVRALVDPDTLVLAVPDLLVQAGPGWFGRVVEAATPTAPVPSLRSVGLDPRRWPGWWWGLVSGVVIAVAGLVAAAVTLGPVLLWYDRAFLNTTPDGLHAVNHHLVHFLRHDRITLAGTMVATGILYAGLAGGGMRRGWPWAREAYLVSGCTGFAAVLFLFAHGYLEPLHLALAAIVFPMFLAATRRPPERPRWVTLPEGPERNRALTGQLLMVITGAGLLVGGVAVSVVGLTGVFVPSDLAFLGTGPEALSAANGRLLPFIAHDRAGFGGALTAAAAAILLLSTWGWRRGESWVWWTLALAAFAGFVPAVIAHFAIGYVDLMHLAPVLAGMALTATALTLARPYLFAQRSHTLAEGFHPVGSSPGGST